MNRKISDRLYQQAMSLIPGGVNSPVRACRSVGTDPLFIQSAEGSRIVDVDGNTYIDYVGSWGPMILGHRHPAVLESIRQVLEKGTSFGAPTQLEVELAEMVVEAVPSVEAVRMVNSGTEATMSAIRLARGVTGREAIVKFDGCYHGHADSLLVEAGSGIATLGIPGSPGVPGSFVAHTYSLPYNDSEAVRQLFQKQGSSIAAVVVEPVAGNMGLVEPAEGFLKTLREECSRSESLLIFDEVMTGFRVAYGGAQSLYNITPDLTCFGKIIGGGLPVGAYGGRKDIMQQIAPSGPIYQAGTLSGNPVAMAAGIATLREIHTPDFYSQLEEKSRQLAAGLQAAAEKADKKVCLNRVGSMLGMFFTPGPVRSFADAKTSDLALFSSYYRNMLSRGIYLAPSQFEALFVSAAHGPDDLQATVDAAEASLAAL
jgi:glutamate-1-semialdehyde 2,1-aminomutase